MSISEIQAVSADPAISPLCPPIPLSFTAEWLTAKDAAAYTSLSVATIHRLVDKGRIDATYFTGNRCLRISRSSIDRWAEKNAPRKWVA